MNADTINKFLLNIVREASIELLRIYFKNPNRKTRLIFPKYRNENIRISEQEFRFVLTRLLEKSKHPKFYYSVETPTNGEYSFQGKGKRSASSDLSLYFDGKKVLNIEFKAHNAKQDSIDKDIEKLTTEDVNGAWIHILKKEDKGTVKTLFNKYGNAFFQYGKSKKPISFHILILESHILLSRIGKEKELNYSNGIFNIEYPTWKELKPGKLQSGDWLIEKFNIK